VVTLHDFTAFAFPHYFHASFIDSQRRIIQRHIAQNAFFIALSENTKKDFLNFFNISPNKVKVIYPGVDDTFKPTYEEETMRLIRSGYNLYDRPYVLYAGRLDYHKNVDNLIRAFGLIVKKKRNKDSILVVAGTGREDYQKELVVLVNNLGLRQEVVFTGYVPNDLFMTLLSNATIFVYPSKHEGFGSLIVEAMACGVPVITSNGSALTESAGDAAILIDPHRAEEIAKALETLLYDDRLRQEFKLRSLSRVKQFSYKKAAEETIKVYKEILEK
jgi:glycosyltransferase involved in cell wall biosynthesis